MFNFSTGGVRFAHDIEIMIGESGCCGLFQWSTCKYWWLSLWSVIVPFLAAIVYVYSLIKVGYSEIVFYYYSIEEYRKIWKNITIIYIIILLWWNLICCGFFFLFQFMPLKDPFPAWSNALGWLIGVTPIVVIVFFSVALLTHIFIKHRVRFHSHPVY